MPRLVRWGASPGQQPRRPLVGIGDDGVRDVVGIPRESRPHTKEAMAPDFVSISRGHQPITSDAKGGRIDTHDVRNQLSNAMKALKEKGLDGDMERVELIIDHGAEFDDPNFTVGDGYLFNWKTGKTVPLKDCLKRRPEGARDGRKERGRWRRTG
ncbi:hypothetical protein WMF04_24965 [Sorangium sp. So ce260]|uniref:hypothetical protein n=1 Tax=Sorangium sp. So ce260 TaxID=3133291 RepID=UPI003F63ACEA